MTNPIAPIPPVILIAPNVCEGMGGEAIMALQIYKNLARTGADVRQITHGRVRAQLARECPEMAVSFIDDDRVDRLIWRARALVGRFTYTYFFWRAARVAREMVRENPGAVVHYTSPVSPILSVFSAAGAPRVIGPINGNIPYPPAFRGREGWGDRLRRYLLVPTQLAHRMMFPGNRKAEVILVDGGERTRESLRLGGCRDDQMRESLTCGIPDEIAEAPLVEHRGANFRFVHNGRLMPHKGADLIIRALKQTRHPVELDIIGRGPVRDDLVKLTEELGLKDRVHFLDWFERHEDLKSALRAYRAFVFPSLAEAHGIVVQEAMMMGLPVICLDWGGPARLVTPECGVLVPPTDEATVVAGLAAAMDRLGEDGDLAARMAEAGRARAIEGGYSWKDLIGRWVDLYRELRPGSPPSRPRPAGGRRRSRPETPRETGVDLFRRR